MLKSESSLPRFVTVYHAVWTIHRVYETLGGGNQNMGWQLMEQITIILLALTALLFQSLRMWLITIVVVVVADIKMMPFIWDSEWWCLLTDFALVISTVTVFHPSELFFSLEPLSQTKVAAVTELARASIVGQMTLFYTAAMFWKLTWDFLSPQSSCAPIFTMQLLDWILPPSVILPQPALRVITLVSPTCVLLLEGFIAYAFWNPTLRKHGVLAAIVLHFGIAACPPPENVATFSLMCASRLVCFVPEGSCSVLSAKHWSFMQVAMAIGATAFTAQLARHEGFFDLAYPLFTLATPVLLKSALLDESRGSILAETFEKRRYVYAYRFAIAVGFFYAFLMIPLGLMDQGQPHMYANLRLHGGSNHIFGIPTSLMQQWFENSPSSVFYGGIVRIESSSCRLLNEIYPSEYTLQMSERSRDMMLQGGHTSRNFNPMLTVCTSSEAPWDPKTPFVQYTIPAHEFRRVVGWIRDHVTEPYSIEYTQLQGHGDEEWRALAPGRRVRVEGGGGKAAKCSVKGMGQCEATDLPNLPPLPLWSQKLMLFEPYPILPGDYKLHCFGP